MALEHHRQPETKEIVGRALLRIVQATRPDDPNPERTAADLQLSCTRAQLVELEDEQRALESLPPRPLGPVRTGSATGSGRRSMLTDDYERELCAMLQDGNYLAPAVDALGGPNIDTVRLWINVGEGTVAYPPLWTVPLERFERFAAAVRYAEARAEALIVAAWRSACEDDWHAAAEFLARRFPQRWAKMAKAELSGPDGNPMEMKFDFSGLSVEQLRALAGEWEGGEA